MEAMTLWKERAMEKGVEEGKKQGHRDGQVELVLRLARRRWGILPEGRSAQLAQRHVEKSEDLAVAL